MAAEGRRAGPPGPQGPQGPKGDKGDTGNAGPQNLFVQQVQPVSAEPWVWFETRGDGTVKTIWVNT